MPSPEGVLPRKLPCPICKTEMREETIEGVTLDLCPSHGMWLDKGELETITGVVRAAQKKRAGRVVKKAAVAEMMRQNAERERRLLSRAYGRFR
jgi:Zn-finger nucleic acid-binding protein